MSIKLLLKSKIFLSFAAAACIVLAWQPLEWAPTALLAPLFFSRLVQSCKNWRNAFWWGLWSSIFLMFLSFYWVVYTLHIFGDLPWIVAGALFCFFAMLGALNFPIFLAAYKWFEIRLKKKGVWYYSLVLPCLFTVIEDFVPKLFPWKVGHSLYQMLWLIQPVDLFGCTFLTFLIFCLGFSIVGALETKTKRWRYGILPFALLTFSVVYSNFRLKEEVPLKQELHLSLIQPSIGTSEKSEASYSAGSKLLRILKTYQEMTESALSRSPKPELVIWSETAIPYFLHNENGISTSLKKSIEKWNIPVLTGGFYQEWNSNRKDYNAAFLFSPDPEQPYQYYPKNVLLAFGEYLPLGEEFPSLYRYLPAVAAFTPGKTQPILKLKTQVGTLRVGCTICYEMILPNYVRKVTEQEIDLLVNLTNDAWYGETVQPREHAALTVFRSIEARVPSVRSTNSGISFSVDTKGNLSPMLGTNEVGSLPLTVQIPQNMGKTVYTQFGDWILFLFLINLLLFLWRARVPLLA